MSIEAKVKTITIGKVIKPHGIRGGVKVKPYTEDLDGFLDYDVFYWVGASDQEIDHSKQLNVSKIQPLNGLFVIYFEGIDSLDKAEGLRDCLLQVTRDTIVSKKGLSDEDILIEDLIGFQVYEDDIYQGYVEGYYQGGQGELYLVKVDDSDLKKNSIDAKDFFIPCDLDYYHRVDLKQKKILLKPNSIVR